VDRVKELLSQIGLQPERVRMFYMSSAMAGQFAAATVEMTEQIQKIGGNPLRNFSSRMPRSESKNLGIENRKPEVLRNEGSEIENEGAQNASE